MIHCCCTCKYRERESQDFNWDIADYRKSSGRFYCGNEKSEGYGVKTSKFDSCDSWTAKYEEVSDENNNDKMR